MEYQMRAEIQKIGPGTKVWVYGNGGFAKELTTLLKNQGIQIVGFISNKRFHLDSIEGDRALYDANRFAVFIGVFNHKNDPLEIFEFLKEIGCPRIISPAETCLMFPGTNFRKYYLDSDYKNSNSQNEIIEISRNLSDDFSREILNGFIEYRQTGDLKKLMGSAGVELQYLGKTLPSPFRERWLEVNFRWLDIGSFDGDTLRAIHATGRSSYEDNFICVEPDMINFKALSECVPRLGFVANLLNVAIGSRAGEIGFLHEGTLSAHKNDVAVESDQVKMVQVITIDEITKHFTPTHIKMDIEGAEMGALIGGQNTLVNCRPNLAISLYHLPEDLTRIPLYLMNLLPDYSWFIRCYGAHGYDTILYGLPKLN